MTSQRTRRIPALARLAAFIAVAGTVAATTTVTVAATPAQAAESVVDVTTFGADRTGARDSTQAVEDAIAHARTLPAPVRLVFPKGTYELYPDNADPHELYISNTEGGNQAYKNRRFALFLEGVRDFTVDGDGSTLRTHGLMGIFAVIGSQRVTVKNFTSDHAAPKVVDVSVAETGVSNGKAYRILSVPAGSPYSISGTQLSFMSDVSPVTGQRYWQHTTSQMWYAQVYNPATGLAWRSGNPLFTNVAAMSDLGAGRIRVDYTSSTAPTDRGLVYEMREVSRDTAAGFVWESADFTLTGVTARYLHGFGIVGQLSSNITITGNRFAADPATGRTTAAFADILQMSGVKGAVTVTDNHFEGAHDDPINIHGTYLEVVGKPAPNKLTVQYMHPQTAGFPQYHVGDRVEIVDKMTMATIPGGTATVTAVDGPTGRDTSKSLTTMTITLDANVPAAVTVNNFVVENTTYTPTVRIARNVFRAIPTRGILLTTRGTSVIEDNVFDGMSMSSIYISSDAYQWYESGPVRDVTIRRNRFLRPASPVIWFDPTNRTVDKTVPVHSGVTIENNEFSVGDVELLNAKSVSGVTFRHNKVNRLDRDTALTLGGLSNRCPAVGGTTQLSVATTASVYGSSLYSYSGSAAMRLESNTYDNGFNLRANVGSTTTSADLTVVGDPVQVGTTNQRPLLGAVSYASSDPTVATVSPSGLLTAHKAGRTTITGVVQAVGQTMATRPVEVVVGGTAGSADCTRSAPLAPGWTMVREAPAKWSLGLDGGLTLGAAASGFLWAGTNNAQNVALTSAGNGTGTATVRMSGRTARGYTEAGLALYQGDDAYVLLQRKHNNGTPTITVVTESGGTAEESRKVTPDPAAHDVWLRLARAGDTVTASYSLNGTAFTQVGSPITVSGFSTAKFGVMAASEPGGGTEAFTFRDLRIGGQAVPLAAPTLPAPGPLVESGTTRCLDATNAGGVVSATCAVGVAQSWRYDPATSAVIGKDNRCLDAYGGSSADGTTLITWPCTGASNQRWTLQPGGTITGVGGKCVGTSSNAVQLTTCGSANTRTWSTALVNLGASRCLEATAASGAPVRLAPCTSATTQRWTFTGAGAAVKGPGGLCLDATDGATDGGALLVSTCAGTTNQKWTLQSSGTITGPGGKCIDLVDPSTQVADRPNLRPCTTSASQKFVL